MLSKKGQPAPSTERLLLLLAAVFVSSSVLSAMRWADDYHLFLLGLLSFSAASYGRMAQRRRWRNAMRLHLVAMGTSYTLLLIAFYVDNGRNLPLWRALPPMRTGCCPRCSARSSSRTYRFGIH